MTTDQAAPAAANPQAAQGRRDAIDHLLFRAACGVIKAEEGALLRTLVEQERDAGDSLAGGVSASAATYARRYEQAAERLRKARQQRTEAREEADRLRRTIERIAEAPLNVDVWARLGMALGWTPERVGAEARKRRLHGEQQLAATADSLRQQLAAAKAEAEGLAETMRNTDRLTEQQLADTRSALRAERGRADNLGAQFRDRRHALSDALGLGTSAPWDAITERARELHSRQERREWTFNAEQKLATVRPMPALADSARYMFGAAGGLTTGGPLTAAAIRSAAQRAEAAERKLAETTAQRDSAASALTDLRNDLYAERAAHEEHRRELATILNAGRETAWSALLGTVAARNADWARCRDEAERAARADVAAARQAEEQAGRTLTLRHGQLADALGYGRTMAWPDLIHGVRSTVAGRQSHHERAEAAERERQAARQGEAEAVRARQAAEAQRRDVLGLLNETERQLGEARRQAEVWRVDAATQAQIAAQRTEERDQLAKRAESLRGQRDRWRTHAHQAVAGMRSEMATEHTCPDGEPCPAHDQPADLAAYTVPVSPRTLQNVYTRDGHPVFELIDGLTSDAALTDDAARDLIGRYYRAITSGPPADPTFDVDTMNRLRKAAIKVDRAAHTMRAAGLL